MRLSGFAGVSLVGPDGPRLECKKRGDCEPPSCPSWLKLDRDIEIAGAFHADGGRLEFMLARDPKHWAEPDSL